MNEFFTVKELLNPPIKRAAYSDRTAWILAQCSAIAYKETDPLIQPLLREGQFELVEIFSYNYLQLSGYLAFSTKHRLGVLAFKGTVPKEWGTVKTDLEFSSYHTSKGTFHEGFYKAYKGLEPGILKALGKLKDKAVPVYLTGHSLGGALAVVAAMNLPDTDRFAACYTYGSPRVCDLKTVIEYYKVPIYRVVHQTDIVPSLPPPWLSKGYAQVGDVRYITDKFQIIPGGAAVWLRFWLQVKAVFKLAFFKMVGDHGIEHYWKILLAIAARRESKRVLEIIQEEKKKAGTVD